MCLAVGANDQADAWYWLDQVSDTWVPYSETDAQKLENGFRDWSGDTELVVDVDFCKLSPNRPIHRVHMTRLKEANGKNFSVNFIERAIIYDDKDDTEHRSRRLQQAEGKDGAHLHGICPSQLRMSLASITVLQWSRHAGSPWTWVYQESVSQSSEVKTFGGKNTCSLRL
jgi:hypothetical protein